MSSSLARSTAFMTAASVGQKVLSFAYFTLIARYIGAADTGKYFFALSFTTIFVVFVDLGLTNVLIREGAKYKEKLQEYLSTVLGIKIWLGLLAYAGAVMAIGALDYSAEIRGLVYLSGITMLLDSLHLSLYGVLRARGLLKYEAASIVGSQLITLSLGTAFLLTGRPLIFLILAFTLASLANVLFAALVLRGRGYALSPGWNNAMAKQFARIALPFALAAIFARVYSYIDSILLSRLTDDVTVGWYAIPYKITYAFQFIPLALIAALYPRLSEYYEHDKGRLTRAFSESMTYLAAIVLPIAVGLSVLSRDIILTLYTAEFEPSILPLKILLAGLCFSFISFPLGALLNACNKQTTQTTIVGIVMSANIALNLILIPRFGVVGAASAALAGNILLTALGYAYAVRVAAIPHARLLWSLVRLLAASGVMGAAVWYTNSTAHFAVAIAVGALVYAAGVVVFRVFTITDIRRIASGIYK